MDDLQVAKEKLKRGESALVFVKESIPIYETDIGGLGGFLEAIDELGNQLSGASVADKVVGKAAALLCAHSNVVAAYAITMSESGLKVLKENNIPFEFETLIPLISNMKKTGQCPFEKLVGDTLNPDTAYSQIKQLHNTLKHSTTRPEH